jgi:hypothetical protein
MDMRGRCPHGIHSFKPGGSGGTSFQVSEAVEWGRFVIVEMWSRMEEISNLRSANEIRGNRIYMYVYMIYTPRDLTDS